MVWSVVGGSKFIDAQGKPIHVKSVRIAEVKFGSIIFRDRFIIAALTSPLISMGGLLKMVGSQRPMRTATFLWHAIPSRSLCTSSATLCVLLESSECCPQMIHHLPHLQDLVMCSGLGAGRGKFSDSIFALRSSANQHVDTTLCPSDCLLWLRTTLIHLDDDTWGLREFCQNLSDLSTMTGPFEANIPVTELWISQPATNKRLAVEVFHV